MNDNQIPERSWFSKHPVLTVLLGIGAIGIISSAFDGDNSSYQKAIIYNPTPTPTSVQTSFPTPAVNTYQQNATYPSYTSVPIPTTYQAPQPQGEVNYYTNTAGNEVQSPTYYDSRPAGASARCRDGTYSFSQSRRGTCSYHGGVAQWY